MLIVSSGYYRKRDIHPRKELRNGCLLFEVSVGLFSSQCIKMEIPESQLISKLRGLESELEGRN